MHLNRQSQRKKDYDYSQPGCYAVTVCTHGRSYLFGSVDDGHMLPNDAGQMINGTWYEIPQHYPCLEIDQMQIMPNHLHGIIVSLIKGYVKEVKGFSVVAYAGHL